MLGEQELAFCANTGRFHFLKDTCCDLARIRQRLTQLEGNELKLFNANTSTLLDSLRAGAAGFSGVMANFHPELYVWLCDHYAEDPSRAEMLQSFLTLASQLEKQLYPVNAKAYLAGEGLPITTMTRVKKSPADVPAVHDGDGASAHHDPADQAGNENGLTMTGKAVMFQ